MENERMFKYSMSGVFFLKSFLFLDFLKLYFLAKNSSKKFSAFTLAEVLVTLTIIGVVSAMTIPALKNKIDDNTYRSALIKNYSIIQDIYKRSVYADMSIFSENDFDGRPVSAEYLENPELIREFAKLSRKPVMYSNGGASVAITRFYRENEEFSYAKNTSLFKYLSGAQVTELMENGGSYTFQLANGSIISIVTVPAHHHVIMMDVNGAANPNRYGKDIFFFQAVFDTEKQLYVIYPLGHPDLTYKKGIQDCNMSSEGFTCAYEIIKNKSFKIPKN